MSVWRVQRIDEMPTPVQVSKSYGQMVRLQEMKIERCFADYGYSETISERLNLRMGHCTDCVNHKTYLRNVNTEELKRGGRILNTKDTKLTRATIRWFFTAQAICQFYIKGGSIGMFKQLAALSIY